MSPDKLSIAMYRINAYKLIQYLSDEDNINMGMVRTLTKLMTLCSDLFFMKADLCFFRWFSECKECVMGELMMYVCFF